MIVELSGSDAKGVQVNNVVADSANLECLRCNNAEAHDAKRYGPCSGNLDLSSQLRRQYVRPPLPTTPTQCGPQRKFAISNGTGSISRALETQC